MPQITHHGGQKVTTYYNEAKREEEGLKRHAQRREQNRNLREKSRPFSERAASRASDILGNVTGAIVQGNNTLFDIKKKSRKSRRKRYSSDQSSNMFAVPPGMNPPGMGGGTGRTRGSRFLDPGFIPDSLRDLF